MRVIINQLSIITVQQLSKGISKRIVNRREDSEVESFIINSNSVDIEYISTVIRTYLILTFGHERRTGKESGTVLYVRPTGIIRTPYLMDRTHIRDSIALEGGGLASVIRTYYLVLISASSPSCLSIRLRITHQVILNALPVITHLEPRRTYYIAWTVLLIQSARTIPAKFLVAHMFLILNFPTLLFRNTYIIAPY